MKGFQGYQLLIIFAGLSLMTNSIFAGPPVKMENLAFKILEKKAVEYEKSMSDELRSGLARYVPESRFHLNVRVFWNPNKLEDIRTKPEKLKRKEGKLPGFPIFVRGEERTLDYYMGNGSVMRLRVDVLLDENLPDRYLDFVRKFVPIQARFVAERGDSVRISRIPFPEVKEGEKTNEDVEIPLTSNEFTADLVEKMRKEKEKKKFNRTVLIHPIIQKYVTEYEKYIIRKLQTIISQYVDPDQFLVNVKFNWNPEQLEKLKDLVMHMDPKGKVKLPGFTIYLEEQNAFYETISTSTEVMKLEVAVLLDDPVPTEVDGFLEKVVPLSFKFLPERGDKLTIVRGKFPEKRNVDSKSTKVDAEGSKKEEEEKKEETESYVNFSDDFQEVTVKVNKAFERKEYRLALELLRKELRKESYDLKEKFVFYKMKGSLHFLLQQNDLAVQSLEKALEVNPGDEETQILKDHIKDEVL